MEKIKSFKDLITWQKAHKLVLEIYRITEKFPKKEIFGLTNQMRRAGVSISSNIAEGFSRNSQLEKNRFYSISNGSVLEIQNQLIIARDIHYIEDLEYQEIISQTILVHKLINGLIKNSQDKALYALSQPILNT